MKQLIEKGASARGFADRKNKLTLLHLIAQKIAEWYERAYVYQGAPAGDDATAIMKNYQNIFRLLVDAGADIKAENAKGKKALGFLPPEMKTLLGKVEESGCRMM